MFRLFAPIILLQCFCVYHAYKNDKDRIWYFIIVLLPIVGCLIYIFDNFKTPDNLGEISENLKSAVQTNHRVKRLQKAIEFSDTINNKTLLADEYVKLKRYDDAIQLYESCLEGYNADDKEILMRLIKAAYLSEDYEKVVHQGKKLRGDNLFRNSEEELYFAKALYHTGASDLAIEVFESLDVQYANYRQRLTYYTLLKETDVSQAKTKLEEILAEFNHMDRKERHNYQSVFNELKKLYESLDG